jgi:hypothetical protein
VARTDSKDELFELSLLGGAVERGWRRARPDIVRLPWHTLDATQLTPSLLATARRFWTTMALQEHRTAAAAAATVQALVAARAPIDLVAHAARFVTDELAHVELCARVAAGLGGAAPMAYDGAALVPATSPELSSLGRAAELVVRGYCVGEALSLPMQQATARSQQHPLLAGVLQRLARDEAAHAAFGWLFLDWADTLFDAPLRRHLRTVAAQAIAQVEALIASNPGDEPGEFGWLRPARWRQVARRALDEDVRAPLHERGLV